MMMQWSYFILPLSNKLPGDLNSDTWTARFFVFVCEY